jgi:hypothetical protein
MHDQVSTKDADTLSKIHDTPPLKKRITPTALCWRNHEKGARGRLEVNLR